MIRALKNHRTSSLAFFFVSIVCITMVVLEIVNAAMNRSAELKETTESLSNVTFAVAQHANETFKETDIVLVGVIERLKHDGSNAATIARTHELLSTRVRELPQLNGVFVYDENGAWLVTSQAKLESKFNNSDREYFQYHRSHADNAPHIGPPVRSRSTGRWILTISRRVNKPDGSFGGVVLATIEMAYFQKFFDHFAIGENGAILLAQLDGTLLYRRPLRENMIGKSIAGASIYRDNASKNFSGSATIKSVQDGVIRINAYRHLDDYPVFIAVALAKEEVLADWVKDTYFRGIIVATLLLVFAYIGTRMVAQVKHRELAEKEANEARQKVESLNKTLERLAMQDGLTGLANRRHFDQTLAAELARVSRDGHALSLIMIDVDHFKLYNDRYGHLKGDECLQSLAGAIMATLNRPGDLAARYGGEEFAIVLPNCNASGAAVIAERIRQCICDLAIAHVDNEGQIVTISLGVSTLQRPSNHKAPASDLLDSADHALYESKANGRNRVTSHFFLFPQSKVCAA